MADQLIVGITAAAWCAAHSWFIALGPQRWMARHCGRYHAFNRLVYNLASAVSLAALLLYWRSLPHRVLFDWPGWWQLPRWIGLAAAGTLFLRGSRVYDNLAFLGLRQIRQWRRRRLPAPGRVSRRGILRQVRHPYYTGAFLFLIFCLPITEINAVWRGVFFVYLCVGTLLEEKKLLAEFGDEYARYQREVPMFLSFRGFRNRDDRAR